MKSQQKLPDGVEAGAQLMSSGPYVDSWKEAIAAALEIEATDVRIENFVIGPYILGVPFYSASSLTEEVHVANGTIPAPAPTAFSVKDESTSTLHYHYDCPALSSAIVPCTIVHCIYPTPSCTTVQYPALPPCITLPCNNLHFPELLCNILPCHAILSPTTIHDPLHHPALRYYHPIEV